MYQPTYEQKKEKFISVLNNHFGLHDVFPEVANILDEDFRKIIELYEKKASVGGKDPWHYLYFEELIIMQQALYEVIKNNYRYSDITVKVEKLFEQELDRRLQRPVLSYGEEADKTYRASYAEMPEYAMTLAGMCTENMVPDKRTFEEKRSAIDKYQQIREDFIKAGKKMPMSYEMTLEYAQGNILRSHVGGTPPEPPIGPEWGAENIREANSRNLREMQERKVETPVHTETEKRNAEIEQQKIDAERQQREIELLTLQQEINKIENEKIEIEKRIRKISSEALGSYFTKQVSEKYPTEYQTFKQQEEQVRNHRSSYAQITDLKAKFDEVSQDLQFYKGVLPGYESFYQRFEQIKTEKKQAQVSEKEQKRIYNLIHKAENERLKRSRSLYTAWDLGNKTIPQEYQGMTYEQVEALLNQKEAEEKARQDAKVTRDELIGKAIRKDLNVPENYHLSQIQIQNLSQQFAGYSNDKLIEFISGVKKQETVPEIKQETSTLSYSDFEKNLISFIEKKNSNLGKVLEIISVTGYPDSTYEVRFEDGIIHQITITQEEENLIENQVQPTPEVKAEQQTTTPNEQTQQRDKLISDILGAMLKAGEFHNSGLDISQKMSDMEYAKSKLQTKSLEELENILSVYTPQQEETMSSGGIKR